MKLGINDKEWKKMDRDAYIVYLMKIEENKSVNYDLLVDSVWNSHA
jgi:hypothetical protein